MISLKGEINKFVVAKNKNQLLATADIIRLDGAANQRLIVIGAALFAFIRRMIEDLEQILLFVELQLIENKVKEVFICLLLRNEPIKNAKEAVLGIQF